MERRLLALIHQSCYGPALKLAQDPDLDVAGEHAAAARELLSQLEKVVVCSDFAEKLTTHLQ